MGVTAVETSHALKVRQYDDKAYRETLPKTFWKQYMGVNANSIVHVKENLQKGKGDQDTFGLVGACESEGVEGESTLEGNEEALRLYDYSVSLQEYAHAIRLQGELTAKRTAFDLKDEARPNLTDWLAQKIDAKLFEAAGSIDGTKYSSASESGKDSWLANNSDRVLFGAVTTNNSSNDHSASLLNVDGTTDKMSTSIISLAKRMAKLAYPKIKPIMINGKEYYVLVMHDYCGRDLRADSTWVNAQQDAQLRGDDNPLFTGAYGIWDNVIIVTHERVPILVDAGNASCDVAQNFLLGAQSLVYEQGGYPSYGGSAVRQVEKEFDYGRSWGCAIMSIFAHGKAVFNSKQHGMVTVYTSGQPD